MVTRQLRERQFDLFRNDLENKAKTDPTDASYTVNLTINDAAYAVKVQPERNHKIVVLQALRTANSSAGPVCELITKDPVLSYLLEILIDQGIPDCRP